MESASQQGDKVSPSHLQKSKSANADGQRGRSGRRVQPEKQQHPDTSNQKATNGGREELIYGGVAPKKVVDEEVMRSIMMTDLTKVPSNPPPDQFAQP